MARQRTIAPKPPAPTPADPFGLFSSTSGPSGNPPAVGVQRPPVPRSSASTKRPAQGPSDERASKRPKHHTVPASEASQNANGLRPTTSSQPPSCPVCGNRPLHTLLDCGVVKLGPVAMKKSIELLEQGNNPANKHVLDQLRTLYSNVTNIAKRVTIPKPKPQNDTIDLT